jgi:hypothetical protein
MTKLKHSMTESGEMGIIFGVHAYGGGIVCTVMGGGEGLGGKMTRKYR